MRDKPAESMFDRQCGIQYKKAVVGFYTGTLAQVVCLCRHKPVVWSLKHGGLMRDAV